MKYTLFKLVYLSSTVKAGFLKIHPHMPLNICWKHGSQHGSLSVGNTVYHGHCTVQMLATTFYQQTQMDAPLGLE